MSKMNTEMKLRVTEIQRFCMHDGPGVRTTVFLKGCPLRCAWCHNPETQKSSAELLFYQNKCIGCGECKKENFEPQDCLGEATVLYGKEITVEELFPKLLEDRDFYETTGGGITL